jgi:isocitrate dehydrogenase kinase/phosphatase
VFYDYDEVTLLTECKFVGCRREGLSRRSGSRAWFYVGKNDIFPEEFKTFLGLQSSYRESFYQAHADLFGVEF